MIMCDWIRAKYWIGPHEPIGGGRVMSLDDAGAVEWEVRKRLQVEGSHSTKVQVRSDLAGDRWYQDEGWGPAPAAGEPWPPTSVVIDGNPVKFFQGHNLWGTDDVPNLGVEFGLAVLDRLESSGALVVQPYMRESILAGNFELKRVDLTTMVDLGTSGSVNAWIRAAGESGSMRYRGRGEVSKGGESILFGRGSRRSSLMVYNKLREMRAHKGSQPALVDLPSALAWVEGKLRAELRLLYKELKERSLHTPGLWLHNFDLDGVGVTPLDLLVSHLEGLTMATSPGLDDEVLAQVPPRMRLAYAAWLKGEDLRKILPDRTFYRYRKELLGYGIDLAALRPAPEASNVVPLHRVLTMKPASIPEWAYGTPLMFEPRQLLKVG